MYNSNLADAVKHQLTVTTAMPPGNWQTIINKDQNFEIGMFDVDALCKGKVIQYDRYQKQVFDITNTLKPGELELLKKYAGVDCSVSKSPATSSASSNDAIINKSPTTLSKTGWYIVGGVAVLILGAIILTKK